MFWTRQSLVALALVSLVSERQSFGQSRDANVRLDASVNPVLEVTPSGSSVATPRASDYGALTELIWRSVNTREVVRTRLYLPSGAIDESAVRQLAHLLRDIPTGRSSPVVQRTLKLIVKAAQRFGALEVDVVSAYRTGRSASGRRVRHEGYHSVGSAVDFRFPTVDMAQVAAYGRTFAHVGVGYYPETNFVHLDSREQSYFWEHRGGRHRRGSDRALSRGNAEDRDRNWTAADDVPWDPPGVQLVLDVHPEPVTRGSNRARRRHSHSQRRHRHHRRHHPSLHVFEG